MLPHHGTTSVGLIPRNNHMMLLGRLIHRFVTLPPSDPGTRHRNNHAGAAACIHVELADMAFPRSHSQSWLKPLHRFSQLLIMRRAAQQIERLGLK